MVLSKMLDPLDVFLPVVGFRLLKDLVFAIREFHLPEFPIDPSEHVVQTIQRRIEFKRSLVFRDGLISLVQQFPRPAEIRARLCVVRIGSQRALQIRHPPLGLAQFNVNAAYVHFS